MSPLLSLLLSTWLTNFASPHQYIDQNYGTGLYPDQLMMPNLIDRYPSKSLLDLYSKPSIDSTRDNFSGMTAVAKSVHTFKIILNVNHFQPEEINVKIVGNCVVVEAKHEERKDKHGFISRHFVRRYLLPDQAITDHVSSSISNDGILTIIAPLRDASKNQNERIIKIDYTGKPAIHLDINKDTEKTAQEKKAHEETTTQRNEESATTPEK